MYHHHNRQFHYLAERLYRTHGNEPPVVAVHRLVLMTGAEFILLLVIFTACLITIQKVGIETGKSVLVVAACGTAGFAVLLFITWRSLFRRWFRQRGPWPRVGVLAMRLLSTTCVITSGIYLIAPFLVKHGETFVTGMLLAYALASTAFLFWHETERTNYAQTDLPSDKTGMETDDFQSPWAHSEDS